MNDTTIVCDNNSITDIVKISVMENNIKLTFAESEDTNLFDRLRQTLFQAYIQTLASPH